MPEPIPHDGWEWIGWVFEHLFTGAGTVLLAIGAYWLKEKSAISADKRKVEYEIANEDRQHKGRILALRGNLTAELSSLQKSSREELLFVKSNTDPNHAQYPVPPQKPFCGTELPIMGYFKDFFSRYEGLGDLEPREIQTTMSAYYSYVERRNYMLKNSSASPKDYKEAVEIGVVPYSFSDPLRVIFLINELSVIDAACEAALLALRANSTGPLAAKLPPQKE